MNLRNSTDGSAVNAFRLALSIFVFLTLPGLAQSPVCPQSPPVLSGPSAVKPGFSYTISWADVLLTKPTEEEHYWVERAATQDFLGAERFRTSRSSIVLGPVPAGMKTAYHRVIVASNCPGPGGAPLSSVLAIPVVSECAAPPALANFSAWPETPLAYSTYVVAWNPLDCGAMTFGRCAENVRYRIRRVSPSGTADWTLAINSACFSDPPGEYSYQVRAEDVCGAAGPWTPLKKIAVGKVPVSLALVSEPQPIFAIPVTGPGPGSAPAWTSFSIRNTGTDALTLSASPVGPFDVSPDSMKLGRGEAGSFTVRLVSDVGADPAHGKVVVSAGGMSLDVPVSGIAATPAPAPVQWLEGQVYFDGENTSTVRTLENPSASPAAILVPTRAPWIVIESTDGGIWDRPMAPRERREVKISVDRGLRRAVTGTETGSIALHTSGFGEPSVLRVVDDGADIALVDPVRPPKEENRTRILFASTANVEDRAGSGLFSTELWVSNIDSAASAGVSLFFTPIESSGWETQPRRADFVLGPGETRRFRNVVAKIARMTGACALEVSSPAPTVMATALVTSTPMAYVPGTKSSYGLKATSLPGGMPQYGFEMRPIAPGEGVSSSSGPFVLTGLRHDARRRTNILLTETSGVETTVRIELFKGEGTNTPVVKNGEAVTITRTIPALGTIQINDAGLFPETPLQESPYAVITFQAGETDPETGELIGSVMPIATVVDQGTEDASLRVGVAAAALNPLPAAARTPQEAKNIGLLSLPFGGEAAPLMFPVVHAAGAPLSSGERPLWKTRVTLTNVNENEQRSFRLMFRDQFGTDRESPLVLMGPKTSFTFEDALEEFFPGKVQPGDNIYGPVQIQPVKSLDGTKWSETWADVDVQTESYTSDPSNPGLGDYKTGMEGYSYHHGYSSFQSNVGTVQIDGAENSSQYRTNLILEEIGGSLCDVAVSVYKPGSFVPIATVPVSIPPFGYISKELFQGYLGLNLSEITDARVVVRQINGDGVFIAFVSKVNLVTGDPANVFLRPAAAGTGR